MLLSLVYWKDASLAKTQTRLKKVVRGEGVVCGRRRNCVGLGPSGSVARAMVAVASWLSIVGPERQNLELTSMKERR